MIRRGKLLEICAESPASGARFVGLFLLSRTLFYFKFEIIDKTEHPPNIKETIVRNTKN
jgi:hypothetical protein